MRRSAERGQGKGTIEEGKRNRDKVNLRESMVETAMSKRDKEKGHERYLRILMRATERKKRTGITGRESAREKDGEKERHGRRMCHRIYERKQGTRREREREAPGKKSRRVERGGKRDELVEKRTCAQLVSSGERREDEGVERDSAVISKREEACGCDVRRPC